MLFSDSFVNCVRTVRPVVAFQKVLINIEGQPCPLKAQREITYTPQGCSVGLVFTQIVPVFSCYKVSYP